MLFRSVSEPLKVLMEFISAFNVSATIFPISRQDVLMIVDIDGRPHYLCIVSCAPIPFSSYAMDEDWDMIKGEGPYLFIFRSFPFCNKCDSISLPDDEHVPLFYLRRV